jgi:hypothetical protein
MNTLSAKQSLELLDRLRTMAMLQNWLWQEAITISDDLLDCELDAVLKQVPDLALATAGPDDDLTCHDVDDFVEHCREIMAVHNIKIDLSQPGASTASSS